MPNNPESKEGIEVYELGYLILPSIAEGELPGVVDKLKAVVAKAGGVELESEAPFKYNLAYTMAKTVGASKYVVRDAYIGWTKFELDPSKALEVKSAAEKIGEVLRLLLIKVPRETVFTFAKAREALAAEEAARVSALEAEKEAAAEAPNGVPAEVIE